MSDFSTNSRTEFVNQVARSITDAQNDSSRTESFIFGLSAKWGEGKTTFLNQLKGKLQKTAVIEINPWKYSDNKVTFLQSFLLDLLNDSSEKGNKRIKSKILLTKTTNEIEWMKLGWASPVIALLCIASIVLPLCALSYFQKDENIKSIIAVLQVAVMSVLIPFVMTLFQKGTTSTVVDKSTSVLIEFDGLLQEIIAAYKKKQIVIYVDDLDRISAKNAITVLDNLRTFFDKKELCFIVSGDHSVIERHLGKELLQNGESQECLEEGRRYLKKIFNIYWRLPIPIDTEIEGYISGQIDRKLDEFKLNESERDQLSTMLNELFDNNYRNIERMVSQIAFTLRIVEAKLEACRHDENDDDEVIIYYENLLTHKMLLIKVLLIQDLANPYYEYLLKYCYCLRLSDKKQRIVYADDKTPSPKILSADQESLLLKLLAAEPRFHADNILVVCDVKPYVYLSADSSFGDHRGLLPSEFDERLYSILPDTGELILLFDQHSIEMLHKGVSAMFKKIQQEVSQKSTDLTEIEQNIINLINGLDGLNDAYISQKNEFSEFLTIDFLSNFTDTETYPELLQLFGDYVDENSLDIGGDVDPLLEYDNINQFTKLLEYANGIDSINLLYSKVLWGCFQKFYQQYYNQFIVSFGLLLDKLSAPELPEDTLNLVVDIINSSYSQDAGKISANILFMTNSKTTIDNAIEKMKVRLKQLQSESVEIIKILDNANLDNYLTEVLDAIIDYRSLAQKLKFVIENGLDEAVAWQYVLDNKISILVDGITLNLQSYGGPQSPNSETSRIIAQNIIVYAMENSENALLSHIQNNNYYFKNLGDIRGNTVVTKYLNKLAKSGDQTNSDNAKRILSIGNVEVKQKAYS